MVADILFDYEGGETFASYLVRDDGFVEISFASNLPDDLYSTILNRLKGPPADPRGVGRKEWADVSVAMNRVGI